MLSQYATLTLTLATANGTALQLSPLENNSVFIFAEADLSVCSKGYLVDIQLVQASLHLILTRNWLTVKRSDDVFRYR